MEVELLRKRDEEQRRLQEVEEQKARARLEGKQVLERQMEEKKNKEREAYEQYLKEKDGVERVMATLLESERQQLEHNEMKKKKAFEDMKTALELKETKKKELADIEKREDEKYMAYIKEMDKR